MPHLDPLDPPEPFCGSGRPAFPVRELLLWFALNAAFFLLFLWWV